MMNSLITIAAFLVTIGLLVAVHEFGHYWVARKLGIKVLRFSIGFGKQIWTVKGKDDDKVEYSLSLIPLGGYVKMLDEREGDVDPAERHRAFNVQPVWKRFLVVLAGPMFNFIFAILAFASTYMIGVDSVRPYLDAPLPNTPAAISGFEAGDRVTKINDTEVQSLNQLRLTLLNEYLATQQLTIEVETAMNAHPDISECAAVEVSVKADVSVIGLFYVAADDLDSDQLAEFASQRLARYKCPRIYTRIETLPKGANGKIQRRVLRDT